MHDSFVEMSGLVTDRYEEDDQQFVTIKLDKNISFDTITRFTDSQGNLNARLVMHDTRIISPQQRMKIILLIRDICMKTGQDEEQARLEMKSLFCKKKKIEMFSISEKKENCCDVTTARNFISYIIDFCFQYDIQFKFAALTLTDDEAAYYYSCLKRRKCVVCSMPGEVHHADVIGMGGNRKKVNHSKHELMCLCRKHHTETHMIGGQTFLDKYHLKTILLSEEQFEKINYKG